MADEQSNPVGRPTKFKTEFIEQAYKLALLGATDIELADFFGVDEATITRWKQEIEEFCTSIKKGKRAADANVAESLYKRACGYSHKETHFNVVDGELVTTEVDKFYPPDTGAAMAWLKNRTRKLENPWKDDYAHDVKGIITLADIAARMGAITDAEAKTSKP